VPDAQSAIEHLARVFLAGFQIPANATADDVWALVVAEFRRLAVTLPDDEADAFETSVRRLIAEKAYLPLRRPRSRGRTKLPPA
jgi:hypothetical protein